jgi:integrase
LAEQKNNQTGDTLSKATLYATLTQLKRFFQWLAWLPGYKSKIQYSDAEFFNLSDNDARIATAHREQRGPTLEQVQHVLRTMPNHTAIERRNRALVAFTLLTGARDGAIASMKLKHIDLIERYIYQDARDVKTKFRKSFDTYFFPVGDDIAAIVEEWVAFLKQELQWGNDDPLFPATNMVLGANRQFEVAGLKRAHWSNASPIRTIFREAFQSAGLPNFNPHSFRNTLARLGQDRCKSPEEYKAWSQNLGHEKVMTTFMNYGSVARDRQGEIIKGLGSGEQASGTDAEKFVAEVFRRFERRGIKIPSIEAMNLPD